MEGNTTHFYCGRCNQYLGTGNHSQCQYCGAVFNAVTDLGTIVRERVDTKLNTKPLTNTIRISAGIGILTISATITVSLLSEGWAAFFTSLATSLVWQFSITGIFFLTFLSVMKALLWEKIDYFLLKRNAWTIYKAILKLRRYLIPLVSNHRRLLIILLLILASLLAMPLLAWRFKRPLDIYDISFNILINIIGGLYIILIEDLLRQREKIKQAKNWKPPPNSTLLNTNTGQPE